MLMSPENREMGGSPFSPRPMAPERPSPVRTGPMSPTMPVFHHGTDYVEHTGPAMLEKGEAVIPKEKNMSGVSDVLGGHEKARKPEKKIKELRHRHGADGTHIFEHHHHHPEHHPMTEHTAHNDDAAVQHFMENATQPNPGEAEADAGQGGMPQGAPGGMPGGPVGA